MQYLYKYTPINDYLISNLKENQIYFSNVNDFNDPLDSHFTISTGEGAININDVELQPALLQFDL